MRYFLILKKFTSDFGIDRWRNESCLSTFGLGVLHSNDESLRNDQPHLFRFKIEYRKNQSAHDLFNRVIGEPAIAHTLAELAEIHNHTIGRLWRPLFEFNFGHPANSDIELGECFLEGHNRLQFRCHHSVLSALGPDRVDE